MFSGPVRDWMVAILVLPGCLQIPGFAQTTLTTPLTEQQITTPYTNNGNLIGNTVGRMGRAIQFWFTYWISPRNTLQFTYKHNTVNQRFVPQGGAWQDYSLRHELYLHSGFYVKSQLQYEYISRYPLLFPGPQRNVTAIVELGFVPHKSK